MLSGIIKQIILISDGHSNKGGCPIAAARRARGAGATVSAIGILDSGHLGEKGAGEIRKIAAAGGGICHFISARELASTLTSITLQATQYTVRQLADQKLLEVSGISLHQLPPANRSIILPYLAQQEEKMALEIVLVLDTSGSMLEKRAELENSIRELVVTLDSRQGPVKLAVIHYPGRSGQGAVIKQLHTDNSLTLNALQQMVYGGFTPTGPALDQAVDLLSAKCLTKQAASAVSIK